jgi:hypothetical protein
LRLVLGLTEIFLRFLYLILVSSRPSLHLLTAFPFTHPQQSPTSPSPTSPSTLLMAFYLAHPQSPTSPSPTSPFPPLHPTLPPTAFTFTYPRPHPQSPTSPSPTSTSLLLPLYPTITPTAFPLTHPQQSPTSHSPTLNLLQI